MKINEYQKQALGTAIYPNKGDNIVYPTLGLCGEAGEVAEKVKKLIRDRDGVMNDEWKATTAMELGDVLWYASSVANELGFTLEEVAQMNLDKLNSRKERNVIKGDGDNR